MPFLLLGIVVAVLGFALLAAFPEKRTIPTLLFLLFALVAPPVAAALVEIGEFVYFVSTIRVRDERARSFIAPHEVTVYARELRNATDQPGYMFLIGTVENRSPRHYLTLVWGWLTVEDCVEDMCTILGRKHMEVLMGAAAGGGRNAFKEHFMWKEYVPPRGELRLSFEVTKAYVNVEREQRVVRRTGPEGPR